jgi:hypothetical protein
VDEEPLHRSRCALRSLWQKYRIYDDRLELDTRFGLMSIPFEHIESMDLRATGHAGSLKGHLQLRDFRPELMLDWTNFRGHVVVDMKDGAMRRVFITPGDPQVFKSTLDAALRRFGESAHQA